ncbi:MAG: hypothetical protein INR70_26755 [Parafilimonas terrae]|nr:hypothetical protein [Parafilimonas terrae]
MSIFKPSNSSFSCCMVPHAGPMAREALEAIGMPLDGDSIQIDLRDGLLTVNGKPTSQADASLVYNAWRCDPRIGPEPHEELVSHMRRAIVIRRMLNMTEGGPADAWPHDRCRVPGSVLN